MNRTKILNHYKNYINHKEHQAHEDDKELLLFFFVRLVFFVVVFFCYRNIS